MTEQAMQRVADRAITRVVSVIVPCFNAAATIEETIASILAQRRPGAIDVEILVSDDGSTDASQAIVEAIGHRHPGLVRFLPSSVGNTGPGAARNRGLHAASGPFVCFLDADDCYAPGFFAAALSGFERYPQVAAISTALEIFDNHRDVLAEHLAAMADCLPSNIILRRAIVDAIGGFPENAVYRGKAAGEDVAFRRAVAKHFTVVHLAEKYFRYRARRGSHFDLFIDTTALVDGQLVATSTEDADGPLARAGMAYLARVDKRLMEIENCQLPGPLGPSGLAAIAEYEKFRADFAPATGVAPDDAYALHCVASHGPSLGFVATSERVAAGILTALQMGARSAGRRSVISLEDLAHSAQPVALRLLVVDLRDRTELWMQDIRSGIGFINSGGCLAVHLQDPGTALHDVTRLLRQTGRTWKLQPLGGRIVLFERRD